ncbi:MAG: FkbM family methyltransferase [Nanoarchaeota archaeon]|nr:FkbM family methyltransferase [Nanoarchaeota archaeon]
MKTFLKKTAFSAVKKFIPESKLALKLRQIKWAVERRLAARFYDINNGSATLRLNGNLAGRQIIFPDYEKVRPLSAHIEMPGYFQVSLLKEGQTIIDAGAAPGDFTVLASQIIGPTGRVYAFEPDPERRSYLEEMLKANNATHNVEIVPLGLNDSRRGITFFKGHGGLYDVRFNEHRYGHTSLKVETTSLDEFSGGKNIDVIKMDIEGTELNAVQGARRLIQETHPSFIIASYHMVHGVPTWKILEPFFHQHYKNVKTLFIDHRTTYAYN